MDPIHSNLAIHGQLNLIASNVRQQTNQYNLIPDLRGTLSLQLNLICNVLCGYYINKLDLACLMWIPQKWYIF